MPRYLAFLSFFTIMLVFWNRSQLFSYHSWELQYIPVLCGKLNCIFIRSLALASQADYWDSQAAIKIFTQVLVLSLPCQLLGPGQV